MKVVTVRVKARVAVRVRVIASMLVIREYPVGHSSRSAHFPLAWNEKVLFEMMYLSFGLGHCSGNWRDSGAEPSLC